MNDTVCLLIIAKEEYLAVKLGNGIWVIDLNTENPIVMLDLFGKFSKAEIEEITILSPAEVRRNVAIAKEVFAKWNDYHFRLWVSYSMKIW